MDYVPKEYVELTKDEKLSLGREVVSASLAILNKCPREDDSDVMCRFVVKALVKATHAIDAIYERLNKPLAGTNKTISRELETPATYVATAFYLWMVDGDVSTCHPASVGGCQLSAFARGLLIAEHMSQIIDMLGESDFLGYRADELPLEDGFFDC